MSRPPVLASLRWSLPALRLQALTGHWRRRLAWRAAPRTRGDCTVCTGATWFVHRSDNPREDPVCRRCGSVPRQRALVIALAQLGIPLAEAAVHESSPSLCSLLHFRRRCRTFVGSYFLPGVAAGARIGAIRCVDLGRQPFPDRSFDLVVTQDVLEHVPDPSLALREIRRTLRPGGCHLFTVPRADWRATRARAVVEHGVTRHLLPPEFHADPVTRRGTLVVTDWGMDLEHLVTDPGGSFQVRRIAEPSAGIPAAIEVFVATNPP